jgi:endonuclease YncB( thermonuclease family)
VLRSLVLFLFGTVGLASDFSGVVTRALDGDTLAVANSEYTIRVRLYGVDAPEKTQAGGPESAAFTERLALNQPATLVERAIDRYGRVVCDVMLPDGRVLNKEIVRAGHGWWYERYAPLSTELRVLEAEARTHRRGLWADLYPQAPWQWRKEERPAPVQTGKRTRRSEVRTQRRVR